MVEFFQRMYILSYNIKDSPEIDYYNAASIVEYIRYIYLLLVIYTHSHTYFKSCDF